MAARKTLLTEKIKGVTRGRGETVYQPGPDPFSVRETKVRRLLSNPTSLAVVALLRQGYLAKPYHWWFRSGESVEGLHFKVQPGHPLSVLAALNFVERSQTLPNCRYGGHYRLNDAGKEAFDALPDEVKREARAAARAALWQVIVARRTTRRWEAQRAAEYRAARKPNVNRLHDDHERKSR